MNTYTALDIENMRETCHKIMGELEPNIPVFGLLDQEPSIDQIIFWFDGDEKKAVKWRAFMRLSNALLDILHNEEFRNAMNCTE